MTRLAGEILVIPPLLDLVFLVAISARLRTGVPYRVRHLALDRGLDMQSRIRQRGRKDGAHEHCRRSHQHKHGEDSLESIRHFLQKHFHSPSQGRKTMLFIGVS
jgi:hypothetical protein